MTRQPQVGDYYKLCHIYKKGVVRVVNIDGLAVAGTKRVIVETIQPVDKVHATHAYSLASFNSWFRFIDPQDVPLEIMAQL